MQEDSALPLPPRPPPASLLLYLTWPSHGSRQHVNNLQTALEPHSPSPAPSAMTLKQKDATQVCFFTKKKAKAKTKRRALSFLRLSSTDSAVSKLRSRPSPSTQLFQEVRKKKSCKAFVTAHFFVVFFFAHFLKNHDQTD